MQKNLDIREYAKQAGVYLWEIGENLGMCDSNFTRLLRKELPAEKKQHIYEIIEKLKQGGLINGQKI